MKHQTLILYAILSACLLLQSCDKSNSPNNSNPIEAPGTLWTKTFGIGEIYSASGVTETYDGSLVTAGYKFDGISAEPWLRKTNASGDSLWHFSYGTNFWCKRMLAVRDGSFLLSGMFNQMDSDPDMGLINIASNGSLLWEKSVILPNTELGSGVIETFDGNFVQIAEALPVDSQSENEKSTVLAKFSSNGDSLWCHTFEDASGLDVWETYDWGYICTGYTSSTDSSGIDIWLMKSDQDGNTVWSQIYDIGPEDYGISVLQTSDGGYMIGGYTGNFYTDSYDFVLIKIDANGNKLWHRTYAERNRNILQMLNFCDYSGYIMVGYTADSFFSDYSAMIIRTDYFGNELWRIICNPISTNRFSTIQQTQDGGLIAAGELGNYAWLVRLGSE